MRKVSWGVLSTAKIGLERVIGPMQKAANVSVDAIASRDLGKAKAAAAQFNIGKAYGSYEQLLADRDIQSVYIPLPNDMHVEWAERALAAGKHVLLEKPAGMSAEEAQRLIPARDRSGKILVEAFMVRYAPQWKRTLDIIASGQVGSVHGVQAYACFVNIDPANIRNRTDAGGGALMDIGCYAILFARLAFGGEPRRVISLIDRDPQMKIDRHTSMLLDFPNGQATLFVSTQLARTQRVRILGTKGSIDIQIPINMPDDRPTRIVVDDGRDALGTGASIIEFPPVNQYTLQGEAMSRMILEGAKPELSIEDSVANMRVIDAVVRSERSNGWEPV